MKLYATTTSERASKGQGGNDFLEIHVEDENRHTFLELLIKPDDDDKYLIKGWVTHDTPHRAEQYLEYEVRKAKKKKADN